MTQLLSGFFQQSRTIPDKTALLQDRSSISYARLAQRAQGIASFLRDRMNEGNCIAVALDRGIDAAITIYGILTAGGCYLPLDIKNPHDRLNFIISDAQPSFIIGNGPCPGWLKTPEKWLDLQQLPEDATEDIQTDVHPESLAAILYTSGSSGTPKGVALSYRAIHNFTDWANKTFSITAKDRIASLTPFHFDLSIFDLFCSLSQGASVHFIPSKLTLSPSRLTSWLRDNKITCWYTVPSILSFLSLKGSLKTTPLANLQQILFAGEVFPTPNLIKLLESLPHVKFFNLYGPTETNVCCYWHVDKMRLTTNEPIPIGSPACNAELAIDAATGELLVNSKNNFSGYWRQGKLTRTLTAESWYHTGDKVSRNEYGEYCYHGRLDRMLKCSGYRVEPAEIETVINHLAVVENCAVIGIDDPVSGQRPAAAVVLKPGAKLADIIQPLRQKLPSYMQPCRFLTLVSLPTLANGKIDFVKIHQLLEKI
jgi:amino acid adenylation domain-containing protein